VLSQKVINRTWAAARSFNIYQLTEVVVVDTIMLDGRAHKDAFGWCDISTGQLQIRITSHHEMPRRLTDNNIIDTIAHELAHFTEYRHNRDHRELRNAIRTYLKVHWDTINPTAPIQS
jgi:hypothetical protein